MWCRWSDKGWSGVWLPLATPGPGLNDTTEGKLQIGARRDTIQGGVGTVGTRTPRWRHEHARFKASSHALAHRGHDMTAMGSRGGRSGGNNDEQ